MSHSRRFHSRLGSSPGLPSRWLVRNASCFDLMASGWLPPGIDGWSILHWPWSLQAGSGTDDLPSHAVGCYYSHGPAHLLEAGKHGETHGCEVSHELCFWHWEDGSIQTLWMGMVRRGNEHLLHARPLYLRHPILFFATPPTVILTFPIRTLSLGELSTDACRNLQHW